MPTSDQLGKQLINENQLPSCLDHRLQLEVWCLWAVCFTEVFQDLLLCPCQVKRGVSSWQGWQCSCPGQGTTKATEPMQSELRKLAKDLLQTLHSWDRTSSGPTSALGRTSQVGMLVLCQNIPKHSEPQETLRCPSASSLLRELGCLGRQQGRALPLQQQMAQGLSWLPSWASSVGREQ